MSPTPSLKPTTFGFWASRHDRLDRVLRRAAVVDHDGQIGCRGDRLDVRRRAPPAGRPRGRAAARAARPRRRRRPRARPRWRDRAGRRLPATTGTAPATVSTATRTTVAASVGREGVELAGAARGEDAAGGVREGASRCARAGGRRRRGRPRRTGSPGRRGCRRSPCRRVLSGRRRAVEFGAPACARGASRARGAPSRSRRRARCRSAPRRAAAVPGWNRGSSSASGSRASASSAPTKNTSPFGIVGEGGEQHVDEGRDIPRVDVVEQGGRRQRRVVEALAHGVALLGRRALPIPRGR